MKTATVPNLQTLLTRKNPKTGYTETVVYTGSLRQKPKGWRVVTRNQQRSL